MPNCRACACSVFRVTDMTPSPAAAMPLMSPASATMAMVCFIDSLPWQTLRSSIRGSQDLEHLSYSQAIAETVRQSKIAQPAAPVSSRNFDAITLRIEGDALVVAIPGAARTIQYRKAVIAQLAGQCIDGFHRAHGDREMGEPHTLRARFDGHRRQQGGVHELDTRAAREAEEAGGKSLRRIHVLGARGRTEIARVEALAALEISGPERNVIYPHAVSPLTVQPRR